MSSIYPLIGLMNPDCFAVVGRITYDGSGVPTKLKGHGYSITDDGAGLFTVTVDKPWSHYIAGGGSRESVLAVGGTVQMIKGSDVPSTRKVSFRIVGDADAVEDPANGDGASFWMILQSSGLPAV